MPYLLRAAALRNYPDIARRYGLQPLEMLRQAGIPADCLQDPERLVSAQRAFQLLEDSAVASGVNSFGLEMGDANRLSTLGLLGLILREEPTVRSALTTLAHFRRLHNEASVLELKEEGDHAMLRIDYLLPSHAPMIQAIEQGMVMLVRSLRSLLGPHWQPQQLCFAHAPLASRATYRRILDAPVKFQTEFTGIVLEARDLEKPLQAADPALALQARQQLDQLLQARGAVSTSEQVRELILLLLPTGRCSIEQVALHLGIHRRTLHRYLEQESMLFSDLLQEVRTRLADQLIDSRERPLTQVAELIGFASPAAFSRWYRQSFGVTAQKHRHTR